MSWFKTFLNKILPEDKENKCGYGPLSLPADHPFGPACDLHDWEFEQANAGHADKPLNEVDWSLFYRWVLIAKSMPTPELQCQFAMQICKYWPLARVGGGFLWDGDPKTLPEDAKRVIAFLNSTTMTQIS